MVPLVYVFFSAFAACCLIGIYFLQIQMNSVEPLLVACAFSLAISVAVTRSGFSSFLAWFTSTKFAPSGSPSPPLASQPPDHALAKSTRPVDNWTIVSKFV